MKTSFTRQKDNSLFSCSFSPVCFGQGGFVGRCILVVSVDIRTSMTSVAPVIRTKVAFGENRMRIGCLDAEILRNLQMPKYVTQR